MIEFTKKHAVDAMKRVYALMKENRDSLIELEMCIRDSSRGCLAKSGDVVAIFMVISSAAGRAGSYFFR